jgi:Zinc finger, C3HC4 type (RING finger)
MITAGTTTTATNMNKKKRKNHRHHPQYESSIARNTTATTCSTDNPNDTNDIDDDVDEELRIYNEQIRYREAIDFLKQQQETLEAITNNAHHKRPHGNTATNDIQNSLQLLPVLPVPVVSKEPSIRLTRGMLSSLLQLQETSCTCPLCHGIYIQPITLVSCAHTFCKSCIHQYTDHSWYCPSTLLSWFVVCVTCMYV